MKIKKKVSIELVNGAKEAYNKLNKIIGEQKINHVQGSIEISLWTGIQRAFDLIEQNPFYGENAKKKQIPYYYIKKYGINNIFIVDLPQFWRMIYTLKSDKVEIVAFVLDIFTHDDYNKRFKFRKK